MAINTSIKVPPGVAVDDVYVRLTDVMVKKNREDDDPANHTHYVTYGVHASKDDVEIQLLELDRFKVLDIDPAADIPALCYADLKERIVALEWESQTSDIEDVENAIPDADDAEEDEEDV